MITPIYQVNVRGHKLHLVGKEEVLETIKCLTTILQEDQDEPPWMMNYGYSDNPTEGFGIGGGNFLVVHMRRVDLLHQARIASPRRKKLRR
jgi:hypothetical protein